MTNTQIIASECVAHGLFTSEQVESMITIPVHTYQYWKEIGYQVRKGEKAAIKTKLWKVCKGVKAPVADEKEKQPKMILVNTALFTWLQVDKIDGTPDKPEKKQQKKTSSPVFAESSPRIATKEEIEAIKKSNAGTSSAAQTIYRLTGRTVSDKFAETFEKNIKKEYGKTLEEYFAA